MLYRRVKRQELLHQKLREQEAVTSLHAKTKELDVEITTLVCIACNSAFDMNVFMNDWSVIE